MILLLALNSNFAYQKNKKFTLWPHKLEGKTNFKQKLELQTTFQHPTPERMVTIKHFSMQFGLQNIKEITFSISESICFFAILF